MQPQSRLAELDALRGIAVLLVLAFHYTTRIGELHPAAAWGAFPFGQYGVHLFFVISGFVIIMTLDRSERATDFLVARFSRLYPAYWTGIVLTTLFLWLADGPFPPLGVREIAVNFSMVQGFLKVPSVDGVYWTLQVELAFYAMALAVFYTGLLRHVHLPILAWLALCGLFYSPLWAAHVAGLPFAGLAVQLLILEFAPFFALGILFYRLYRGQGSAAWNYALIAAALALVAVHWPLEVAVMILAACGVLWKLLHGGLRVLRFAPLVFFGTISYSLYLVHQRIGQALLIELAERGWSPAARVAAATALAVALATAVTFLVERPALQAIRQRYRTLRRRGRAMASAHSAS